MHILWCLESNYCITIASNVRLVDTIPKNQHIGERFYNYDKLIHFTAYSVTHHPQATTVMMIRVTSRILALYKFILGS